MYLDTEIQTPKVSLRYYATLLYHDTAQPCRSVPKSKLHCNAKMLRGQE